MVANQGWLPGAFTVDDYRARVSAVPAQIVGGAVVSGSFQAFDQTYLVDALARLGPGYVGVTQLPVSVTDAQVLALHDRGVRAVRFNLRRGGSASLDRLEELAHRVFDLAGWHAELYVEDRQLADLEPRLRALPKVSIDHLGLPPHVDSPGLAALLRLVEHGARVKASGFGRFDADPAAVIRAISAVDPGAVLFGTDLPSTRAPRPFSHDDVALVLDALGEPEGRRALAGNALLWYRAGDEHGTKAGPSCKPSGGEPR